VAAKAGVIYFVEVKYRASSAWGSGLEYITTQKFKQMRFAAEFWLAKNKWASESRLAAMELTGDPPRLTNFLNDI
jgi:Holliday junction resolvase-like predicted endonuclease